MAPILFVVTPNTSPHAVTQEHLSEEGFDIRHVLDNGDKPALEKDLTQLITLLDDRQSVGLVAYGAAASTTFDILRQRLCGLAAVIAYYPPTITEAVAEALNNSNATVHLAPSCSDPSSLRSKYVYSDAEEGFADHGSDTFDKVATSLAWSRSLAIVRRGFGIEVDLEKIWEEHLALEFATKDAAATMKTMIDEPYVNHIPTLTGGIGQAELFRFYRDFFVPNNPPSMTVKLISRTIGTDRVVDEMVIRFKHTQEVPWMLPGVPPTDKEVSVVVVGVICIRGGKLYHEHIHWDQASVLVQVGLLDPLLVPEIMKSKGMTRLPVFGAETATKVLDEASIDSNALIPNWSSKTTNGVAH